MSKGGFQKVGQSEKVIYGPRKLLLCGYNSSDREKFRELMETDELATIPVVFADQDSLQLTLKELFQKDTQTNPQKGSKMYRAVIMAGISEQELHTIINRYRSSGMPAQFWATLTPISENWQLKDLLEELKKENAALRSRQIKKA